MSALIATACKHVTCMRMWAGSTNNRAVETIVYSSYPETTNTDSLLSVATFFLVTVEKDSKKTEHKWPTFVIAADNRGPCGSS